jgi:hypothetical protein
MEHKIQWLSALLQEDIFSKMKSQSWAVQCYGTDVGNFVPFPVVYRLDQQSK